MTLFFAICFVAHALHALVTHTKPDASTAARRPGWMPIAIQTPLFLAACVIAFRMGAFGRELVFPPAIVAGLIVGHAVFGLSLWAVHRVYADAWALFADLPSLFAFLKECPNLLLKTFMLSVTEELIYRVAAQGLLVEALGRPAIAIAAVAIAFALTHRHFYRNGLRESGEFLLFSLLLGVLYHYSGSLILVTLVHAVRNIEIAHVDYVSKLYELEEDEAAAWRAFEEMYGYQGP